MLFHYQYWNLKNPFSSPLLSLIMQETPRCVFTLSLFLVLDTILSVATGDLFEDRLSYLEVAFDIIEHP